MQPIGRAEKFAGKQVCLNFLALSRRIAFDTASARVNRIAAEARRDRGDLVSRIAVEFEVANFMSDHDRFVFSGLTAGDVDHEGATVEKAVDAMTNDCARLVVLELKVLKLQSRSDDGVTWVDRLASDQTMQPEATYIAPGSPADRAGFKTGDRITHINGVSILAPEGSRRFGAVVPGQRIRLTVLRNGTPITRELTLDERPRASYERRSLRYTGRLSGVAVEVWSAAGATVQREGDTMVIDVGGSTVRLKATR